MVVREATMTPSWKGATAMAARTAALVAVSGTAALAQTVPTPVHLAWAALGVDLHLAVERFEVRGRTLRQARSDLAQKGPRAEDGSPRHALTTYDITAQWTAQSTPGRCRIADASVGAEIHILLPRWSDAGEAPEPQYLAWQDLERDLAEHEAAHRDLALAAAHRLSRKLGTLEAATCPALDHLARAVITKVNDALRQAQEDLDRDPPPHPRARRRPQRPAGDAR